MPAHDEGRDDRLRPAGGGPEQIDDRDPFLHRLAQPAVIRRVRVGAHECVFDNIIARVDLPMSILLIVIPDAPALPGEHGSDGQQVNHLPGLEDAALWVHQGYALAVELEASREIRRVENAAPETGEPVHVIECRLSELNVPVSDVGRAGHGDW